MAIDLKTAQELEQLLGTKYFYRQSIYRLAQDGQISSYEVNGVDYFSAEEVILKALQRLTRRLQTRFPWLDTRNLRVKNAHPGRKEITIYGFPGGFKISANTDLENEEDLLQKIENARKEVIGMPDLPVGMPDDGPHNPPPPPPPPPPAPGFHPEPPRGPEEHHREVMDVLRRIEDLLRRLVEK